MLLDVFQDDGSQRNLAGERCHERVLRDHRLQIADSVTQPGWRGPVNTKSRRGKAGYQGSHAGRVDMGLRRPTGWAS